MLIVLHAVNPDHHGPAGGRTNLEAYAFLLSQLGAVTAILIGVRPPGTQDVSNGVFRDLVVTGRHATTLFDVRIPGALLVFLPILGIGLRARVRGRVLRWRAATRLAERPRTSCHTLAYIFSFTVVNLILAIGLAAFTSSRVVVGVLIAWNSIVSHLLIGDPRARRSPQVHRRRSGRALLAGDQPAATRSRCRASPPRSS